VGIASPGCGTAAPASRLVAALGRPRGRQGSSSLPVSCLVGKIFLHWFGAGDIRRRLARYADNFGRVN
jgi:hypothetical protein